MRYCYYVLKLVFARAVCGFYNCVRVNLRLVHVLQQLLPAHTCQQEKTIVIRQIQQRNQHCWRGSKQNIVFWTDLILQPNIGKGASD